MKKFLLFLVIAIASISIGLTIYYFSIDNEVILIRSSYLVIEDGDTISTDGLVDFKYRDENTKLTFSASNTEENTLLTYKDGEGFFTTEVGKGGESKIIVKTTNRNYPELTINVLVCNGSEEYPYIINNAETLSQVGRTDSKYTGDKHYKLGADITFKVADDVAWTPISEFSGVLDGNFYTISNLTITNKSAMNMENVGFIATIKENAIIKNLYLKNIKIDVENRSNVGSVAGLNQGTIMTTEVTGEIKSTSNTSYVGGIAGTSSGDTVCAKIDRCGFEGPIVATGVESLENTQTIGGVAGYNNGSVISESYFRVIGNKQLSIGSACFGGIVGVNEEKGSLPSNIYDSYCFLENGVDESANETIEIYNNIAGVVYKNSSNSSATSYVMGNYYYCGSDESGVSKLTKENVCEGTIDGQYNGYIKKESFTIQSNFISYVTKSNKAKRYWSFDSTWEMGVSYPLLNIRSAMGSTYPTDTSDVIGENDIASAEDLYTKLNNEKDGSFKIVSNIDFADVTWIWGDETHPLFDFDGTLTSDGYVIKNFKVISNETSKNVGMFANLGTGAFIKGLTFENATITYDKDNSATRNVTNVGLLAGVSKGATIVDVTINGLEVDVYGSKFGGIVGVAEEKADKYISNVTIKNLNETKGYFTYAGGIVGDNGTVISVDKFGEEITYNTLVNIKLNANYVGGAVGRNSGTVSYVDVSNVKFNETSEDAKVFSQKSIVVGGIAGVNKGVVSNVYANLNAETVSGKTYSIYIGGLVGYNTGAVSLGYASGTTIKVTNGYTVYAGGLVGVNAKGMVTKSIVKKGSINCSVANHNSDITKLSNVSIVGGLVGFDEKTSNQFSFSECVSLITSIKGAFVGGLAGDANGIIERCASGSKSSPVEIVGFTAGGLAGIVPGKIYDCYTICTISGQYTDNSYDGVSSIVNLKVSAVGGFTAVMMKTDSEIRGCYAVANFKNGGVRFSTCADLSSTYNTGKVVGGIYVVEGTPGLNKFGKILSETALNGTGDNNYQQFFAYIGSNDKSVWDTSKGGYPKLYKVEENVPKDIITQTEE